MAMSKENVSQIQDAIRCDLCIEAAAQLHCDTCLVYVCNACVGTHITTDTSKQHVVVEMKKRSKIKLTECNSHSSQRCDLQCKQCNVPVCSKCMASTHANHTVIDILDFCKSKQEEIRRDNTKIESIKMSKLKSANSELKEEIANLPKRYAKTKEDIAKHGKEWHKQVDVIIHTFTESVDKMMNVDLITLRGHQQMLEETISLADQIFQENSAILKSSDASAFDMYKSRVEEISKVPLKFDVKAPEFTPMQFNQKIIDKQFGALVSSSVKVERNHNMVDISNMQLGDVTSSSTCSSKMCEGEMRCISMGITAHVCQFCGKIKVVLPQTCTVCHRFLASCIECIPRKYGSRCKDIP